MPGHGDDDLKRVRASVGAATEAPGLGKPVVEHFPGWELARRRRPDPSPDRRAELCQHGIRGAPIPAVAGRRLGL